MSTFIVGIDVSRQTLDVAIARDKQEAVLLGQYTNDASGFERLVPAVQRAAGGATIQLVMEPTGGYEQPLAHLALDLGWRVSLPNPRHVRDCGRVRAGAPRPTARMPCCWPATAPTTTCPSGNRCLRRWRSWRRCWPGAPIWRACCARIATASTP